MPDERLPDEIAGQAAPAEPAKATDLSEAARAPVDRDRLNKLLAAANGGAAPPRTNIYVCETCREHIVTVDRDQGVTPFMIACNDWVRGPTPCAGMMRSSMYRVFQPHMKASHEWYRPSAAEHLKAHTVEHVAKGGLLLREVAKPVAASSPTAGVQDAGR